MTVIRAKMKRRKKRSSNPVSQLFISPGLWPVMAMECFSGWFYSRSWFSLGVGSLFAALFALLWIASSVGRTTVDLNLIAWYHRQYTQAGSETSSPIAEIAMLKLATVRTSEENRVRVAMLFLENSPQTSEMILSMMAPEDASGTPEAHLRMAQILLGKLQTGTVAIDRVAHHAKIAFDEMPRSLEAKAAWAQVLLQRGEDLKACSLLEEAAREIPELNSEVAALHLRMGNRENAQRYFDLVIDHFRSRIRRNREDYEAYREIAKTYYLLERTSDAVQVAEEAFRDAPMPETKQLLLDTIQAHLDAMSSEDQLGIAGMSAIRRSLELEPRLETTLSRLVRTICLQSHDDWTYVRDFLERDLGQSRLRFVTRIILAIGHAEHDADRYSQFHIRQAYLEDRSALSMGCNIYLVAKWLQPPEDVFAERWMAILEATFPNQRELEMVKNEAKKAPGQSSTFPLEEIQLPEEP